MTTKIIEAAIATLYLPGAFGYRRKEVKNLTVEVGPHAQYSHAYKIRYTEKGKRKPSGLVLSHEPRGLIVAGHGHSEPRDPMQATAGGSITRHSSCSPEWDTEFKTFVAEHMTLAKVLLDITTTPAKQAAAAAAESTASAQV